MPAYLLKPVVWNSLGYVRPGGGRFSSGYPKENGFGHEEWNAGTHLSFEEGGRRWRAFHTESVGHHDVESEIQVFVFMVASHGGRQDLVGIAGNATPLFHRKQERRRLVRLLGTDSVEHADEAWALSQVRRCFASRGAFLAKWRKESHWAPTWKCPESDFVWLPNPVKLNAMSITGKHRFVTMYSSYQPLDRAQAARILSQAFRANPGSEALVHLVEAESGDTSDEAQDLWEINARADLSRTERAALILARRGQGQFREGLMQFWGGCAVTGCVQSQVLRASHIKPWRHATDQERLDPANGLLLVANLDALFDAGLLTFDDGGAMKVSPLLSAEDRGRLALGKLASLRLPLTSRAKEWMALHRETIFKAG